MHNENKFDLKSVSCYCFSQILKKIEVFSKLYIFVISINEKVTPLITTGEITSNL